MISGTTDLGLALANDLRPIVLRVARELRKETEQFGVTSRQVTLLALVNQSPGLTCARSQMPKRSPRRRSRSRSTGSSEPDCSPVRSEVDRRRVGLELTPEGARLLRSMRERRTAGWPSVSARSTRRTARDRSGDRAAARLLGERP